MCFLFCVFTGKMPKKNTNAMVVTIIILMMIKLIAIILIIIIIIIIIITIKQILKLIAYVSASSWHHSQGKVKNNVKIWFIQSLQISIWDFFLSSTQRTLILTIISLPSRRISYFLFICVLIDESPEGDSESKDDGFAYTVDLVKFIRCEFGDHFTLGVVGKSELMMHWNTYSVF